MLKEAFIQEGGGEPLGRSGEWWARRGRDQGMLSGVFCMGKSVLSPGLCPLDERPPLLHIRHLPISTEADISVITGMRDRIHSKHSKQESSGPNIQ